MTHLEALLAVAKATKEWREAYRRYEAVSDRDWRKDALLSVEWQKSCNEEITALNRLDEALYVLAKVEA